MSIYPWLFKRVFDLIVAVPMGVILLPFFALVSLLIALDSRGPILFLQKRTGRNGKVFRICKFRTMKTERFDKAGRELADFERITSLGRFIRDWSIDELPQLFNIIKGDMSLIGPRPLLPEYLEHYTTRQMRRHEVKPGVTGWAQVNGRNTLTWEEKFEYDIWYVENRSFRVDLTIFFMTIVKVFKRDGVNQDNATTMERFSGTKSRM